MPRRLSRCAAWPLASVSASHGGNLNTYILKLYVVGSSPRAQLAIANLRRICEEELRGQYTLEIIDVLQHPDAAENDRILATRFAAVAAMSRSRPAGVGFDAVS